MENFPKRLLKSHQPVRDTLLPQESRSRGVDNYTKLQASIITAAEHAYQKAGAPSLSHIIPFRDYHFCVWVAFRDTISKYPMNHAWGTPTPTTSPPPFHVAETPSTGNGLIADKEFGMGEQIFSERPIVLYPSPRLAPASVAPPPDPVRLRASPQFICASSACCKPCIITTPAKAKMLKKIRFLVFSTRQTAPW